MYDKGKYITGEVLSCSMPVYCAVCFPETIEHSAMKDIFVKDSIQGAGFFRVNDAGKVEIFGESKGLGIGPHPVDYKHVSRAIGVKFE